MSKYIIDTGDYLFTTDGVLVVGFDCDNKPATFYNSLDNLEELNSDYINEHYGELQDEAYQRGFEDGKKSVSDPDRIEVGDIVDRYIDGNFDSRGIYLGGNGEIWDCLFWANTLPITLAYPKEQFKKTGKHYDIQSILEEMRK